VSFLAAQDLTAYSASAVAIIAFIVQRKKYAKSIAHTLGLEPFLLYIGRGFGYRALSRLRPWAAARLSLRDFVFNRLESTSSVVHVPAPIQVQLPLDDMFVPLTAVSAEQNRISATQMVRGNLTRVILVGDPGSGKSTVVRKIYRDICRTAIAFPSMGMLPVLIELKNLEQFPRPLDSEAQASYLFDIVRKEVESVRTYSSDDLFSSFAGSGHLVVMLDGLDEVRTQDLDRTWQDIVALGDQLARLNSGNMLIVTTRRQLYVNLPDYFLSAFKTHLTLEPFTPDEIYQFLVKWPYISNPNENIARLFRNLATQPNIQSMCATPLILAMYVALDQLTGGENLPETRPDFYRAVTDELLVRRRSRQFGLTTGLNMLRRNRQQILGTIALEHLLDSSQSRNNLRWDSVVGIIQRLEGSSWSEAEVQLRELSRDTGLFTEERREESIRFIHLTFCEFLAGQMIANGETDAWQEITARIAGGKGTAAANRPIERFSEVIVFAAALEANQRLRQQRIRWAVESSSFGIALRTIVDCQAYDDTVVLWELDRIASRIAQTSDSQRDEAWLYSFRQVAITLRDKELVLRYQGSHNETALATFFRNAVADSIANFELLFLSYVRLDTAGALEMGRTLGPEFENYLPQLLVRALDQPDVLTYVLSEFRRGGASTRDWAPVLAIGALTHPSLPRRLSNEIVGERLKSEIISQHRRKDGWNDCWSMRDGLLGYIYEAGCCWPGKSTVLRMMAQLPVRRTRRAERFLQINTAMWVTLLICLFAPFVIVSVSITSQYTPGIVLVAPTEALFTIGLGIFFYVVFRLIFPKALPSRYFVDPPFISGLRPTLIPDTLGGRLVIANPDRLGEVIRDDYSIRTLRYYKIIRRNLVMVTPKLSNRAPLLIRMQRYYRPLFSWSPNSKYKIFWHMTPSLISIESGADSRSTAVSAEEHVDE
jgi:hypothetical protein